MWLHGIARLLTWQIGRPACSTQHIVGLDYLDLELQSPHLSLEAPEYQCVLTDNQLTIA